MTRRAVRADRGRRAGSIGPGFDRGGPVQHRPGPVSADEMKRFKNVGPPVTITAIRRQEKAGQRRRQAAHRPGRRRTGPPWWFAVPAVALFAFIVLVPTARGVYYAFTDWDGLDPHFSLI